jgi:hypothetical protein
MEFAAGGDLARLIAKRSKEKGARFTETEVRRYATQLASALDYLVIGARDAPAGRTLGESRSTRMSARVGHVLTTCTAAAAAARDLLAQKVKLPPSFECV